MMTIEPKLTAHPPAACPEAVRWWVSAIQSVIQGTWRYSGYSEVVQRLCTGLTTEPKTNIFSFIYRFGSNSVSANDQILAVGRPSPSTTVRAAVPVAARPALSQPPLPPDATRVGVPGHSTDGHPDPTTSIHTVDAIVTSLHTPS